MQTVSDLLLTALGATGEMSMRKFDEAFTEICLTEGFVESAEDFRNIRRKAVRLLDALGFCEFDFETNKVYPCPPSLVSLPVGGVYRTVLTGVRNPELLQMVESFVRHNSSSLVLTKKPQWITEFQRGIGKRLRVAALPSAVYIEGHSKELLIEMAGKCGLECSIDTPSAWALAQFSISLHEYSEQLPWKRDREDELNWTKSGFSPKFLSFKRASADDVLEGLVEYIDPVTNQRVHWFWNGDHAKIIDRDWGRYLALSWAGRYVIGYDVRQHVFIVPSSLPLPRFLARAVALCSGTVPVTTATGEKPLGGIPPHFPIDVYTGVPPEYALLIASKLSQRLVMKRLRETEHGMVVQ